MTVKESVAMSGTILIILGVMALTAPFLTIYLVWRFSNGSARFKTIGGIVMGLCISKIGA